MGSIGSGRRYKSDEVKPVVENQISINILDLKKRGHLKPGTISSSTYLINSREIGWILISAEEGSLSIDYHLNGQLRHQIVQITSISPYLGGQRKYLLCPQCQSKREILYHRTNGEFACRICHGFVFRSQQLNPHQRHSFMAEKYKKKMDQSSYPYKKPFRMWNKTFLRLKDKACMHEKKSCNLFIEYADNLFNKYGSGLDKKNGL